MTSGTRAGKSGAQANTAGGPGQGPGKAVRDGEPRTLITGATGFLGRNLLYHLLEREAHTRFVLLIRGSEGASPRQRLHRILATRYEEDRLHEFKRRIDLVLGDVTWERFGLDDRAYEALAASVGRIVHGAATVTFSLPIEQARAINVGGTRNLLDFAAAAQRGGQLGRMDYIGTAFVAGTRKGPILEEELDAGQGFNNTYEQTKFEAEKLIRQRWGDVPVTVHRPSIVVGESRTGKTSSFNVLYFPLKIYVRGVWRWIPGRAEAHVDIVPVDFVCEAIEAIAQAEGTLGHCYHVTASENDVTMGEIAQMAASYFGQKPVSFIHPRLYMGVIHPTVKALLFGRLYDLLINKAALYLPYFMSDLKFDNRNAREILARAGIEAPRVQDYFSRIFQFCLDTDWGKKLVEPGD